MDRFMPNVMYKDVVNIIYLKMESYIPYLVVPGKWYS